MLRDLRVKIRNRRSAISSGDVSEFFALSRQFFSFIQTSHVLQGIIAELTSQNAASIDEAKQVVTFRGQKHVYGETAEQAAAIAYTLWKAYSEQNQHYFLNLVPASEMKQALDRFRDWYVEPLFEYLDEAIEDKNIILATLIRYKEKIEWYRRSELQALFEGDTSKGEERLMQHMYEYLFDQGIPFQVEPKTASGRPDVVSLEDSNHPLIADAKIFDASNRAATYIKKGLYQVFHYCSDRNESVGYLIVFNVSPKVLRFQFSTGNDGIPRFEYSHKTIFVVVIDIHAHDGGASKRPIPDTVTITAEDVVREIQETENSVPVA